MHSIGRERPMTDASRRIALARLGLGLCALATRRLSAMAASVDRPDRDPASAAPFARALRIPADRGLLAERRLDRPIDLTARVDVLPVFTGHSTGVWNFAATSKGLVANDPLLVARRGDRIDVTLVNLLGQDTTIHWHGIGNDEANDGSGLHPVRHGERYRYAFEVRERAGLYWYHAHPHFRTGEQVQHGLASLLLVEDPEELALRERLGLPWCVRDLPLLVADKQLGRNNELVYKAGADDWIGNRVVVNWTPEPHVDAERGPYRLRIANASNARMFKLAFVRGSDNMPFHLLGTDGGLLERPIAATQAYLAPAQRLDLLVDLGHTEPGDRVRLRSLAFDPMENDATAAGEDPMLEHPGAPAMGARMDLMEFRMGRTRMPPVALPARLCSPLAPTTRKPDATRAFRLHISDRGRWLINDWNFLVHPHAHEPSFTVKRGAHEIWEFANEFRSMPHPIHLHGFHFRVLERRNSPPQVRALAVASHGRTAQDAGMLDTVVVWPGERVRIAIDFAQPFSGTQRYMLHCHNLEHEDQGMMVTFAVVD
ncbi:MAG TPA: multicopper oxidase family protein [Kofleriaceae bacterium]|nr:multicopper oxidase family protein [Kofleriaceae bacterium]